ncbi:uncharacterized protein rab44 isoform X2 [Ctenopharyngodon idella]|uniref:uncharacterized protein rab44 isoform X2 n=1 Tax=Ctenopharyngodon idella TaxID=7959 RepID=UPI00222F4419|nr:uncharacterized protein rab44 isoform X2 [Ctenopharyngodon idella]
MSGRRPKKNQRLGSSRRGPKGLKNFEQDKDDDDDGLQQIAESGDGQNEFHTTTDYHSAQFDHPPGQQTSVLECPPHASSHKDSLMETELPERKRKMGSTRKSPGGFKVERKLEVRSTEELDEYLTQPNTSATEEQHSSLTEDEQSRSSSFPSSLSLQTESSGLGGEPQATFMVVVPENEEKDAIRHQEITSHSYEVVNDTPIDKTVGGSVHFSAATVAESDLLREDSVMFNELNALSRQETPLASTSGQKRRMGSTRRPLRGKNRENIGVQEDLRSMTENERKAEVIDEGKFSTSEEMAQMWDGVARDDPSSHTESSLVSNLSLLAELKELDVSAGTETMNQSVAFPLVDPEKPLPETSSHHGTPLLNKGLDFKFGSYTEDFDVLNKVLEEAGSHFSDNNQHVPDTRKDTNTSHNCRDVNTVEAKEEVLKQKEEPSRNNKTSSLSPRQDAQLEELVLNSEASLSQHDNFDCSTAQIKEGGNRGFVVPASNISHAEPTETSSPHEMSDAVKESQEIYMEKKHENNVCDVDSITCDTLTDLECVDEDERGSETDNGFEMTDQGDARDHKVTQIIMEVRDNKEDGGTSTETVWISHQEPCEVSTEKEELHREQEYSSTISQTQSVPSQDNAGKMLENKEAREDKGETENTVINDVTSKSEEMLSFEDSATETGSHAHQQQFMQSPEKEGYDLSESGYEEREKEGIFFSAESENMAFDRSVGRGEETEGIEGMDATVLILDVEKPLTNANTACNDSESDFQTENPEQNRVLTEEQNSTSPDTNLEAFQVSDNVSTVIDSSLLLHVAVGSEETDTIAEESYISSVVPEDSQDSYKLTTFHSETQGNEGDDEIVPVGGDKDLQIQTQNKDFYSSTSESVGTEENIHDVSVLVREYDVNVDTVTVESNRTTESDFLQTSSDALKVSENPENEVLSDINIIPEDSLREEAHSKSTPIVHKRKMGSTRRPLKGNKGKERKYHDENETLDSEAMINVEKETFSLDDEPSPDESSLQISKDGAKEQEVEICEKNDVGPAEGSESDLMQSSFSLDLVSEESTAVTVCHITESQTLTKINEESQEDTGDAERVPAEGDTDSRFEIKAQNKLFDSTTCEAEGTEEISHEASVSVREDDSIGNKDTVESDMTSELVFLQSSPDVNVEALKVSENAEKEVSGEDSLREEAHSKSSPIVHKRKMGSTRRPLRGDTGQRKGIKYDENETVDSESMINVEKETLILDDEPSPDESSFQISKDGAKEQEVEICEKNNVGPAEGSESDLMQSSFSLDLVSEESTAVTVCHITESQTLTKINEESQEDTGDAERVPAEGDTESHSEIQTENKMSDLTSEAERTEENICEATVLMKEDEVIGHTVTVESNMTIESELLQNDTFSDAKLEASKVSEKTENVSSVTDTGLVVQNDATEASRETDAIPDQSDTNIIPEDSLREEAHSKSTPIVHKRKMGSTRRPLKGNKGQRKGINFDENETVDSESMINVEKETFLDDEPSPDEFSLQISKDGAKEQEVAICEKNDVGPVEGSESDLMQSSFSLDLVSEESTAVTVCHITESQTLTKINEESQEDTGDAEKAAVGGDTDSRFEIKAQNKLFDSTTCEAEGTEEISHEASVSVREDDSIGNKDTVESDMTSELVFLQSSPDVNVEALTVSENAEKEVSGEDSLREEAHSKSSPIVHKRKMGSTRRPLRGNKGQRKGIKYDENETVDSESMINVEKETLILDDEPSPDESSFQISKDGAKEQEVEICEKNDVGPAEGSESDLMQSSFSLDLVSEESTAVTVCHITESQTLTKINEESQEDTGDAERVPAEGDTESHSEIQTENKMSDLTSEAERTEENICEATVLMKEDEVIGHTVTVESNMTIESELLQNDTFTDAKLEASKVSENTENVSSVTDTGLVVQDDATEASRETDAIPDQSDTNIIPEDSLREEAHSKSTPIVHKRKMGSTRRPLKGNKGKERKYHDENETLDSEAMINVEKETFSLDDEPSTDESSLQISKDGAKEQEVEICEKNDVGPAEGSESDLMQSSFSLDLVSEESTAVTVCHITESQTLTKINEESQENTGDAEKAAVGGDTDSHFEIKAQNKLFDSTTCEAEGTEEISHEASVSVREDDSIGNKDTVESDTTSELVFLQSSPDVNVEALKVSENAEKEVSGEDSLREEAHSKSSPIVHKRKMGSTRRPLRGNKGQRKGIKYDENETVDSESMINVEKETLILDDEPSPDESSFQISKDGAKEQEVEICEKNDVGPAEGSESDLMQSSFSLDLVSEESTAVTVCHITESQTLTKINEESQEDTGDAERVPAEGDTESHSEIQTENKMSDLTSEAERTEENICEATVLMKEDEVIGHTVTVESNMTIESELLQNDTFTDAKLEASKVSENTESVSSVTDTGLVVQNDATEASRETDAIPDQSDTNIIPEDSHREEAHSKSTPIVHKRKMGSTRRPLKGNKGKERKYHDENETVDSEAMINVEKETFSLDDEPSPDESSLQISKDGAKEQEVEICEKNDVGPAEGSESDLMQSSFSLDLVSEESTAVTVCHITESQTLTKINEESQEDTGDAEKAAVGGDTDSHFEIKAQNKLFDSTTCEAEGTEEISHEASVSVREDDSIGNKDTVESDMTSELVFLQSSPDVNVEALTVSENAEKEVSGEDSHREEAHSKSSPIVHKRKMGSTRRPLRGDTGQRKRREYHDENETLNSESMINVEKETFSLEDQPSPDEITSQRSKDEATEGKEICEKNDVGPAEGSESDLMQSSFSLDLVSEESTAVTVCHITESQTLTKINEESRENTGDAKRVPAEGDTESHSEIQTENKMSDLTSEAERTEENICEATVLMKEDEVIGHTVTVESNMTIESELLQNDTFTDAKLEASKVSENTESVSSVTDTGLVVQDDAAEASRETDAIPDQSDTNIIPEDSLREEAHSKSTPIVHKRKMGSTRRPLKGNKGQRKGINFDENETVDSESMINIEKETFLDDEPSPDEFSLQNSKDGAKEQEVAICEKNDVGPVEGSESDLMQSSFSLDLVSEESTAVTVCHITESQTLTKINEESQEDTGDAEKAAVGGDTDSRFEIKAQNKLFDSTTCEAEGTEEISHEASVSVREDDSIGNKDTVESDMTSELVFLQSSPDVNVEALKVSENAEKEVSGEDSHREEAHSKSTPIVHKRKMGSTRRPLRGNKGQRKGIKYDENETVDSESMINVEKETLILDDEPSPDESSFQISKDGAKEQEVEICEKNDVGPAEGSESDLMQSSFSLDLVSEESTAVTVCHITESQTLTKINEESQEDTGDAERVPAEGDTESHSEIQTENKMSDLTSEAERTEENICEATVLMKEDEVIGHTVTVESNMTTESDFHQNVSDAHVEELKVSENVENKVSGETDTSTKPSDNSTVPAGSHREEVHAKLSPVVHKRKMGSTRRPLRGDTRQRKDREYHDENETFNSENIINVEKETFSLEDKSTSQSSKDAQKLTGVKLEALKLSENTENVSSVTHTGLLVQDDTTKGYSDMTTESDFHQKASSHDAHVEEFEVSKNVEKKASGETDTITEPSDINIIPEDTLREEAHSKSTPVVHKRKMGSTRRPLSGNKGQRKVRVEVSGEEDTETLSEIQDQDNVVDHNVTQEIMNIRDNEDEERMTTKPVDMSVQLCDDLEQEQRSDVSQTQTGPSQDDTGSHLLDVPERTADFVRDSLTSHSDLVLSDALLMEETQIHVSSEDVVMGDTSVPPTEVVEMHSVSNRSLQKRKMGSTRKRGKRMVNEEEVEEEKEGEAENTTIDDGTTKSEEKLTLEEAITGSPVHQQAFSSSAGKEGFDIQEVASKSDVQTENSEESDQKQAAEMASDLPLGDAETYSVPEQREILSIITEESHRKDVQSNSIPVVQKRKMGSTRKTFRGNKGQRREVESKEMDGESKGMAKEQDTDPHLATSEGENKLDEDTEQTFPVEFSHQAAISNMFSESEDGVKEVSLNIHDPSDVSEEKGIENTENDSNSLNEAINLYEGTTDKFVLTVSREDVHQSMSADYLDQNVHGASEPEQTETMCHPIPTQELKITQDDVVHENSSQKIPSTHEKRRKMGSTRRKPREMRGENMGDQNDILDMAMDRETKKAENDLDDMPLASSISQLKEMSSEAVSTTDLESEMLVGATDLKGVENDYQNNSDPSEPTAHETPENTLQICENQLVNVDVTKHLQPETVTIEKRRKMGSTRKNLREGRIRGKRDAYEDTETADTHLQMSQDSEMSLVGKAVGEQTIHDYSNQSEDSLLSEIERALNKTSQSSLNYELFVNQPNSGDLANIPDLNKLENSEIKSQLKPSQSSKTHSEPNSPERRRRKMGSTRKNPRQQIKAEREDEDKEDGEIEKNLETNKQEIKDLERVEVSVVHNIPENKLNKEYLDVPSAHTSGSQLEESGNPVVQEKTSPSTKRKFGSRRTNKGKQGLGRLDASDSRNELEDGDHKPNVSEIEDNLHSDLTVCDPYLGLQPGNQPISQPISQQSNMEARNEEAAPKGTDAGLVSLDQIIKHDRSTGTRQSINLNNRNIEVQFNVVMVGNSCVGKTSFVRRFHEGQFTEDFRSTIGVDTCVQTVVLPERTVKLQIWDTAGQERFHSITTQVFHKADGLLLMYEITCSKSFISVRDWISQARERAPDDAIMILLGNKNDSTEREVQIQEGVDLAREYDILFMECSAATGANVSESMRTLAELLVQRKTQKEEHTKLRREPPPKKSGCC